ncbi:hypothetical protein J6A31_09010 [bacterium]|nr:hypothetical protein [bacterium]
MTKALAFNKLPRPSTINDNILLLTHIDADGAGATIITKSIFNNVTTKHCSNATMSKDILDNITSDENYDIIIACDISCDELTGAIINKYLSENPNRKFVLIDHHMTAQTLNKYDWACVHPDMIDDSFRKDLYPSNKNGLSSGTGLLYDYMDYFTFTDYVRNDRLLKHLVHLISAYDTWDWVNVFNSNTEFKTISSLCMLYGIDLFEEEMIQRINSPDISTDNYITATDELLIKIENNKIQEYIKSISKCFTAATMYLQNELYTFVFCSADKYHAEVFEAMKQNYPNKDLYIINYGNGISIRSVKPHINVGELVKPFSGGGHPGAGGFKIPFEAQKHYLELAMGTAIITLPKE